MSFFVRVKLGDEKEIIEIAENDLNVNVFAKKVQQRFKIPENVTVFYLHDQLGFPIENEHFSDILRIFCHGSTFCVVITFSEQQQRTHIFTSMDVKNYFKDRNLGDYLTNYGKKDIKAIDVPTGTDHIIKKNLVNLLIEKFTLYPNKESKLFFANAVLSVFPYLQALTTKDNPVKSMFDPKFGWAFSRLKYRRGNMKLAISSELNPVSEEPFSDELAKKEVDLMKTIVVSKQNLPTLKQKLDMTRNYRIKLSSDPKIDLKQLFPYFFSNPELILFEFEKQNPQVSSASFTSLWPSLKIQLRNILETDFGTKMDTEYDEEIEFILVLLKLFPHKIGRSTLATRLIFNKSIEKFFVHLPVGHALQPKAGKCYPHIVFVGDSQKETQVRLIRFENLIFPVPADFSFTQTFDLFFKIHSVFAQQFDPLLQGMMSFVEHFVFKITSRYKPTAHMTNIWNAIHQD